MSHAVARESTPSAPPTAVTQARTSAWLALLGAGGTLVCCVLPALFVTLGAGATFASLIAAVPALVVFSQYKAWVFGGAGVMLAISVYLRQRPEAQVCPPDPVLAQACARTRAWSGRLLGLAITLYLIGGLFAFVLPRWLAATE